MSPEPRSRETLAGRSVVVTGATSGIGRATALALSRLGARLVLLARRREVGQQLADVINREQNGTVAAFVRCDLASSLEVRRAATEVRDRMPVVDILINNAGARFDRHVLSVDGVELTFATNHLGHFQLTCLLLDSLMAAPSARVITVASSAHFAATAPAAWSGSAAAFESRQAYARSKLANVLFAYEFARRLRHTHVTSNAVDPGLVATRFARNNGTVSWLKHLVYHAWKRELVTPARSAAGIVELAVDPQFATATEGYFRGSKPTTSSDLSHRGDLAEGLWRDSVALSGINASIDTPQNLMQPATVRSTTPRVRTAC